MQILKQVMRHPAGRFGITVGLAIGVVATMMGNASKALLFVGLCRVLASRLTTRS